jgi:uncharacterized protein (DUF302 family)
MIFAIVICLKFKVLRMKKLSVTFLLGLLVGVLLTVLAIVVIIPKQIFVVKESKLGFEQTVEHLEKLANELNWGVPHKYDLQATLKGKGFDVQHVKVFSLCKPSLANEILSDNNERRVSALLPCRIAVFEKGDKTYISMTNTTLISMLLSKKSKKVMSLASAENEKIIDSLIIK